jgi:hypothetical protein
MAYDLIPGYAFIGGILVVLGPLVWLLRAPIARSPRWERWNSPSGRPTDAEIRSLRRFAVAVAMGMIAFGVVFLSAGIGLIPPFGDPP